ncbi:IclR family transcriptional regulator domain-containing protein [Heliomarina baculiformis]|uniref:IclR family transcriptional regulator domain-containing protein n=1 Tax=Heliomarina baculiformis TaxID=2872036 RepID=UPI001EE17B64|nr:IclR family transcriptional regulator C-terminal domain-containing protein [Heliomarina baculiformis]
MAIKPTDYIGSLAKGLAVLEAFDGVHPRLSVAQAAEATGLDRAAARRCLLTLTELGYAQYDGKFFALNPRVLRLGSHALASMPLTQIVQPWLDQLSERIGESVSVSILDGAEIIYVARAAQRRVMSIGLMPGSRLPAHCTSMGRILLGALGREEAMALIRSSDLSPRTPNSLTDPDAIMEAIEKAQRDGYALVDQEIEIGLRSLAVALVNPQGRVQAALNVGVSAAQKSAEEIMREYLPALQQVRQGIQPALG